MSLPPPSETSTLPVTLSSFKNALIKSSKKANKEPNQQEQSVLIQKLPQKIRKIIWQYMIGGNKIKPEEETILRMQRFWPFKYTLPRQEHRWRSTIQTDDGSNDIDQFLPRLENVSALVKTCRLLKQEAIDVLYGCNRFMFNTTTFQVASETTVMSHHFARLRIMYFFKSFDRDDRESWAHICETIAGMPNLHTLHMRLCHTSEFHHEHHKKQERGGSQQAPKQSSSNPEEPDPISEEFILNSLYQIEQAKDFKVELEPRWGSKGFTLPTGHSDAPFRLICEYAEDVEARREKIEQEQRERLRIRQREQVEEYRLKVERKNADELERKAQEMVQAYQSLSG